jgi:hypothetical protein
MGTWIGQNKQVIVERLNVMVKPVRWSVRRSWRFERRGVTDEYPKVPGGGMTPFAGPIEEPSCGLEKRPMRDGWMPLIDGGTLSMTPAFHQLLGK